MKRRIRTVRLGTRGSQLARIQSQWVADRLEMFHTRIRVELVVCRTTGDQVQDKPLYGIGGKGLFVKELEEALLDGRVDFVVHSMKDVPVTMPLVDQSNLMIAAVPRRADPRDVLISQHGRTLKELPRGAHVGTGSFRRRSQILAVRPDLQVDPVRGNIDTRLGKCRQGRFDAVVLALSGLQRSGMFNRDDMEPISTDVMLPAAGQGALAIQCRSYDHPTRDLVSVLEDHTTHQRVDLERSLIRALNGDCHSPIGVLATIHDDTVELRAAVGTRGGEPPVIRAEAHSPLSEPFAAVHEVYDQLVAAGARELLAVGADTHHPMEAA